MKKMFLIFLFPALLAGSLTGQNLIAVQNGGAPYFYQQVDSALIHAQNGDTIFIPGGTWNIAQPVNKLLFMIGVGHHPDSTKYTFPTKLIGQVLLAPGASSGLLKGVFLEGNVITSDPIEFYSISRCHILGTLQLAPMSKKFTLIENIIEGSINGYGTNCSFFNNIITAFFSPAPQIPFINSIFRNNVFLSNSYCNYGCYNIIAGQYLTIENNIFLSNYIPYINSEIFSQVQNSIIKNNLFTGGYNLSAGTNVGSNNITQEQNSIFVNQTGNSFNYTHDYHLSNICLGKSAGVDGTDIGIYGGAFPWKEGSIPFNPHFQQVQIAPKTDSQGNLNVNIRVKAQDR